MNQSMVFGRDVLFYIQLKVYEKIIRDALTYNKYYAGLFIDRFPIKMSFKPLSISIIFL